jgi:hypothetical protein
MYDRRRGAVAALLALSLLLLPSLSFASGNGPRHSAGSVGPVELVIHWLARAWSVVSGGETTDHAWQAAGCGIDPNGQPFHCDPPPSTSAQTVEIGGIDPAQ